MAAPELLPWLAVRGGVPLSPTGRGRFKGALRDTIAAGLKGFDRVLIWDLDGMEKGKPQLDIYRRFEGKGLWVDTGVNNLDGVIDVLVAGADIAVLNLRLLPRLDLLEEATAMTDKLSICVEEGEKVFLGDRRAGSMRAPDLFKLGMRSGVSRGVYLRDSGLRASPDWVTGLEGLSLFSGPAMLPSQSKEVPTWNAVVDLKGLI